MGLFLGRPLTGEQLRAQARHKLEYGDRSAAMMALETAVRAEPDVVENHVLLGRLLMSYGGPEAARQAFNAALVLDPSCAEARQALALLPARPAPKTGFAVGDIVNGHTYSYLITDIRIGGFSVVYLAECRWDELSVPVALKTSASQAARLDGNQQRVMYEAIAWLKLPPHPHVVTALMVDALEGTPCLVLQQVNGRDLGSAIASQTLSIATCIDYALQICDAMTFLSRHGVKAHGDLTPANCLLDDGHIRLIDLGAAAAARETEVLNSTLGLLRPDTVRRYVTQPNTTHYLPPEWLRFGRRTTRGDLYSFGVLLAAMLGSHPKDATRVGHSSRHGMLPQQLTDLIRRCIEPSPRRRPRSFAAVRAQLEELRFTRPTRHAIPKQPRPEYAIIQERYSEDQLMAQLHLARGVSMLSLNRFYSANRMINSAIRLDPRNPTNWALRASLYRRLGDDALATQAAEQTMRLVDESPESALAAASTMLKTGDLDRLAKVLAPALDSTAHAATARFLLCAVAAEAGRWRECVTWADDALHHTPADLHLLLALKALGLHFCGERRDALATAAMVTERRPLGRLGWVVLSLIQIANGDLSAAAESVARVRDLASQFDASAWALRGRIAEAHGRYDEAGRSVVEARAAMPETEAIDQHVATAVLTDDTWAQRALDQSKRLGDLVSQAHERSNSPESLSLIAKALRVDPTSQHAEDCLWAIIRDLGGARRAVELARKHFSGEELNDIVRMVTSRVESAQSTSET